MNIDFPFNIKFVNVRGLGLLSSNHGNFRNTRISNKIKELECGNTSIPTFYALLETKLKQIIKLLNYHPI